MKVYVASSWRNKHQQKVVAALRTSGHDVYDFRNPSSGDPGFAWSEIDPRWLDWTPEQFTAALNHPAAKRGYDNDWDAMIGADCCVMVLPCGKSAHLELGFCAAAVRWTLILMLDKDEPELMYKLSDHISGSMEDMISQMDQWQEHIDKENAFDEGV